MAQDRLEVEVVVRTGPAAEELVRYTSEHDVDLAIVQARGSSRDGRAARARLDDGRCAVLVLR